MRKPIDPSCCPINFVLRACSRLQVYWCRWWTSINYELGGYGVSMWSVWWIELERALCSPLRDGSCMHKWLTVVSMQSLHRWPRAPLCGSMEKGPTGVMGERSKWQDAVILLLVSRQEIKHNILGQRTCPRPIICQKVIYIFTLCTYFLLGASIPLLRPLLFLAPNIQIGRTIWKWLNNLTTVWPTGRQRSLTLSNGREQREAREIWVFLLCCG